ncbi:MAG: type II toxin-antitoxin system Phd/YefM family antitoxin [Gammaproteobacteria bacterium]
MIQVNIHEAKTRLSQLLALAEAGEEVVIARGGRPVARLSTIRPAGLGRLLGRDAGLFEVPEDFNAPLPAEVLDLFER